MRLRINRQFASLPQRWVKFSWGKVGDEVGGDGGDDDDDDADGDVAECFIESSCPKLICYIAWMSAP